MRSDVHTCVVSFHYSRNAACRTAAASCSHRWLPPCSRQVCSLGALPGAVLLLLVAALVAVDLLAADPVGGAAGSHA